MNPDVSRNPQDSQGKLNFKCSDLGPKNCDWQVSGNSEQEIMPKIEQHGREKHNMTIDDVTRNKVRTQLNPAASGVNRCTAFIKSVAVSLRGRPAPPFPYCEAAPSFRTSKGPIACFLWNNAQNRGAERWNLWSQFSLTF